MNELFPDAPVRIREDLVDCHRRAWHRIASPGAWLDGRARTAIARETRNASSCGLCRERKDALSPHAVDGSHDNLGVLPEALVEVVHRVVTDPARLSRDWYTGIIDAGVSDSKYVETVGVTCTTYSIDGFARALGMELPLLPEPIGGEPTKIRPKGAKQGPAWVPWVAPEDITDAEEGLYAHGQSNVCRALSLVPSAALEFFDVVLTHYLPGMSAMRDFSHECRAITRVQIELLAARISALNQCVY